MKAEYVIEELDCKLFAEPKYTWGGSWTDDKLNAFEKYVNAYLTIMNKYRDDNEWRLIYFDGFAGSGTRDQEKEKPSDILQQLFKEDIQPEELSVYKGAAERVLNIKQRGFDYYYFIDSDKEASLRLKEKLKGFDCKMEFRTNDANEEIQKLANALHENSKLTALVLLDPFGMQINWSSIEKLAATRTDLWILIPTGVIINRLLDKRGELLYRNKLESFFGLSEQEIRDYFYVSERHETLFWNDTILRKVEKPIEKIADLFIERLKLIFNEVSDKPLAMYNSCNVPIFHFAFASNNKAAKRIAEQIVGKI